MLDQIKNLVALFWPCEHEWHVDRQGYLERGGDGLTSGAHIGEWTKWYCARCNCQRTHKKIW